MSAPAQSTDRGFAIPTTIPAAQRDSWPVLVRAAGGDLDLLVSAIRAQLQSDPELTLESSAVLDRAIGALKAAR